jgi:MFS family permease
MGLATESLVDNAVLAWTPSVLVRGFGLSAGFVGPLLGTLLMLGGGAGMLAGGLLSDPARTGKSRGRIPVALAAAIVTLPVTVLITNSHLPGVLVGVTLYVLLACISESAGTLALLDSVPNHRRGLVTATSFFLNVAFGAGIGPAAVGWIADHFSLSGRALAAAILAVAGSGFVMVIVLFSLSLRLTRGNARNNAVPAIDAAVDP